MKSTALGNFDRHLRRNPYPGRGIVIGRTEDGAHCIVYWIMGRSPNSRNRRFVADGGTLTTVPADPAKVLDPSLILYEAMLELPGVQLVSNGDQTRTIYDTIANGGSFDAALETRQHEPDSPNYTPRISGMLDFRNGPPTFTLSKLSAAPFDTAHSNRTIYRLASPPAGLGYGITTYDGDSTPLPSFSGDPLLLPLLASARATLEVYWQALDADNRISAAVKTLNADGTLHELSIENRY